MKGCFNFILILAVFLFSFDAFASEKSLSWKDAVKEAQKIHPELISAREALNQSKAVKAQTQSSFFPQISAGADAAVSKSEPAARRESYSYAVEGTQLLFDGFKTYYDVEQAAKNINASEYNYEVVSSNVRFDLSTAFTNLLKAKELQSLTERIAKRRLQSRDLIKLRYDAGREHKGSLLTSEANLSQADFEVEQAKRNEVLAGRRFLTRFGRTRSDMISIEGDLSANSFEREKPNLEVLAEKTPLLRQLIVLKEAAKWGIKSSQADFFPKIYANASAGRSASDWPPDQNEWGLGATLSLPLFEGGNRIATLSKSEAISRQAEAEEKSGRNGVLLTLEQAWDSFQDAVENIGVQKNFLVAAEERAKIAEAEYSTGLITFNDWIIIEDNLVRAEKSYLDARADALLAEAEWKQAKGETLDEE